MIKRLLLLVLLSGLSLAGYWVWLGPENRTQMVGAFGPRVGGACRRILLFPHSGRAALAECFGCLCGPRACPALEPQTAHGVGCTEASKDTADARASLGRLPFSNQRGFSYARAQCFAMPD